MSAIGATVLYGGARLWCIVGKKGLLGKRPLWGVGGGWGWRLSHVGLEDHALQIGRAHV